MSSMPLSSSLRPDAPSPEVGTLEEGALGLSRMMGSGLSGSSLPLSTPLS